MIIEQIYTGCLAQGAYYVESDGECMIIDPLREVNQYIEKATENGAKIKYILETHFHADFVSGHLELSKKTGATIVYGPTATPSFDALIATDGQILELGKLKIKVLHTPGHTMESTTYLLFDENGKEYCIFSGDTLFIGDVGRPDLAQKSTVTIEDLAGYLFDSLRNKIMTLPDDLIVYPAHGAGSACGKNMSKETFDTLGNQKQTNYALRANMTREEFIKEVTDGLELVPPPYYFPKNVMINKSGAQDVDTVKSHVQALSPAAFEAAANETGAIMIDTRQQQTFKNAFVPNSIFIGIKGDFAPWVGTLLTDIEQPILIIADEESREDVITRLSRVGYDNIIGYLEGGIQAWENAGKETDSIVSISAEEFANKFKESEGKIIVKDVRKPSEYMAEHIDEAMNIPLANLSKNMVEFSKDETNYLHCASGYRSMVAASILKSRGYDNVVDIAGGFKAISETDVPRTDFVCQTKMK
ncbi:MBL fold metallo-hydrolase [Lacihabitans sp. LS3-19]|uniref:MBL fold metallo-hydrolase n=1 Tax=Lacihabitans sp. LS3-19 TaxID=2487335 RepID=UPI0020CE9918|nr:MBL fold metallo-hydrolase [Lacihabitans sp. LS3-19]MCP9768584.1 MBL fold metallo-hydrolase [Lacihabitans sp. LS3-19]